MSASLSFESFEEAIGVKVINTNTSCTSDVGDPIATTVAKLINYVSDINTILDNLCAQLDTLSYLNELIGDTVGKGVMSRAKAKRIDEAHSDFLSTIAHINDFTELPSKANLEVVKRFLDSKVIDTKDKIVTIFGNDMFKSLMSFITITKENDVPAILRNMADDQNTLREAYPVVSVTKALTVFKDGLLYKACDFLLDDNYMSMVEKSLIDDLDFNKFKVTVDNLKTLIARWAEIEQVTPVGTFTYKQILDYLIAFPLDVYTENYSGYMEVIQQVVNTKKLSDGDVNYKNIIVDYTVNEKRLCNLNVYLTGIIKILVINYIMHAVNSINTDYLYKTK